MAKEALKKARYLYISYVYIHEHGFGFGSIGIADKEYQSMEQIKNYIQEELGCKQIISKDIVIMNILEFRKKDWISFYNIE